MGSRWMALFAVAAIEVFQELIELRHGVSPFLLMWVRLTDGGGSSVLGSYGFGLRMEGDHPFSEHDQDQFGFFLSEHSIHTSPLRIFRAFRKLSSWGSSFLKILYL